MASHIEVTFTGEAPQLVPVRSITSVKSSGTGSVIKTPYGLKQIAEDYETIKAALTATEAEGSET